MGVKIKLRIKTKAPQDARYAAHGKAAGVTYIAVDLFLKNGVQCADLICSGALQRFPRLKCVLGGKRSGWLPFMLEAADYTWLGATQTGRKRGSDDLLPSELFRRTGLLDLLVRTSHPHRLLDELPVTTNILFETDFPHRPIYMEYPGDC